MNATGRKHGEAKRTRRTMRRATPWSRRILLVLVPVVGLSWIPEPARAAKVKPPQSIPTLQINDISFDEGQAGDLTNAVFTVSLSEPTSKSVSVDYFTQDGTATGDLDYVRTSRTLVFPKRTTQQAVTIQVLGDTLREDGNEAFYVVLAGAVNATITDGVGRAMIIDDELIGLYVEPAGRGGGAFMSDDGLIDCRSDPSGGVPVGDCHEFYRWGVSVTLTAQPDQNSFFKWWSSSQVDLEACQLACTFQIDAPDDTIYISALFGKYYPLTVVKQGSAAEAGRVTSSPAGIDCGTACTAAFPEDTYATFTATAEEGAHFVQWNDLSGRCDALTTPECTQSFYPSDQTITDTLWATFEYD